MFGVGWWTGGAGSGPLSASLAAGPVFTVSWVITKSHNGDHLAFCLFVGQNLRTLATKTKHKKKRIGEVY